ncbi:hypothetical protein ACFWAX_13975 [Streptomyces sp. NPDC059956]|uniref:hypothetical protein n=1 Tax=Streptomyces sp. NPDC059956 TaxID=3347015 RepID=UPI00364C79BA
MRQLTDYVEWTGWENTDDTRVPVPPEFRFDAARYDAELARVVADHSWEEPVDTAARLLAHQIARSGWLERGGPPSVPQQHQGHGAGRGDHGVPVLHDPPVRRTRPDGLHVLTVSDREPVEEQVRRFVERITATDPRASVEST